MSEKIVQAAGDIDYWRRRAEQAEAAATAYKGELDLIAERLDVATIGEIYEAIRVEGEQLATQQDMIDMLRWQLRMVLEFYQTPPPGLLSQGGVRWAVLVEAWRLCAEPEKEQKR